MAKRKGGPNKSAAIREYVDANPSAKPKEIVDALAAQGLVVSPAFVSTIKSKYGSGDAPVAKKTGRPKAARKATGRGRGKKAVTGRPAAAAPASKASDETYDNLILAKKLADQMGGVANAKAALSALEKITG